jgi:hypothetical protein
MLQLGIYNSEQICSDIINTKQKSTGDLNGR